MRFVIQRVNHAHVTTKNRTIGSIGKGYLVLIGISQEDTRELADKMLQKMLNLRIFGDDEDRINLSLKDIDGELLLISQFTLYANCRKGNRPSFFDAGKPDMAEELYDYVIKKAKETCPVVESGEFGAYMKVSLENDGPFTIVLDSDEIFPKPDTP